MNSTLQNRESKTSNTNHQEENDFVEGNKARRLSDSELSLIQRFADKSNQSAQLSGLKEAAKNRTGLPNTLKSGMESNTGIDLSDVKVHYNSPEPSQLNAHAFAKGNNIHLAPGQSKHLPHELGHVVQQKEGRVKPNNSVNGEQINDDSTLENEATKLGNDALNSPSDSTAAEDKNIVKTTQLVSQLKGDTIETTSEISNTGNDAIQGGIKAAEASGAIKATEGASFETGGLFDGLFAAKDSILEAREAYRSGKIADGVNSLASFGKSITNFVELGEKAQGIDRGEFWPGVGAGIDAFKSAIAVFKSINAISAVAKFQTHGESVLEEEEKKIVAEAGRRAKIKLGEGIFDFLRHLTACIGSFAGGGPAFDAADKIISAAQTIVHFGIEHYKGFRNYRLERLGIDSVIEVELTDNQIDHIIGLEMGSGKPLRNLIRKGDFWSRNKERYQTLIAKNPAERNEAENSELTNLNLAKNQLESFLTTYNAGTGSEVPDFNLENISQLGEMHRNLVAKLFDEVKHLTFWQRTREKMGKTFRKRQMVETVLGNMPGAVGIESIMGTGDLPVKLMHDLGEGGQEISVEKLKVALKLAKERRDNPSLLDKSSFDNELERTLQRHQDDMTLVKGVLEISSVQKRLGLSDEASIDTTATDIKNKTSTGNTKWSTAVEIAMIEFGR